MTRQAGETPSPSSRSSVLEPEPPAAADQPRFGFARLPATRLLVGVIAICAAIDIIRIDLPDEYEFAMSNLDLAPALIGVFVAWLFAFAATTAIYIAGSDADTPELLRAAARASVPATWYVPAALFLSAATPISIPIGLLLVANSTRQLFSIPVPDRHDGTAKRRRRAARIFQSIVDQPPRHALPLIGACALELGVVAVIQGNLLFAALACGAVAAMWTRSAVSRGAARERLVQRWHDTLVAVILTVIFAVALASIQIAVQRPPRATGYDTARYIAAKLVRAYNPPAPGQFASRESGFAGPQEIGKMPGSVPRDALPGVKLIPPPPRTLKLRSRASGAGSRLGGGLGILTEPFQIPFTGEYQLFAASVGEIVAGSPIYRGSPLDMEYATITGAMVDTIAWQPLDTLIDFSQCGVIQVAITTGKSSGSANLQLVAGGQLKDVGLRLFGVVGGPEETLQYELPGLPRGNRITALRLVFHRDTREASHSVRVAVRGFTLVPRGR